MATATAELKRTKGDRITLDYGALLRAVKIASHAVATRPTKAVMGSLCIGNGLVSGYTLGEYRVDVELLEAHCAPVLLPRDRLQKILQNSTHDDVTLIPEGSVCVLKIGRGEWRLPTEDANEFPLWEPTGLHNMPSLPSDEFARAARHVIYAIDKDSNRYSLGGVLVEAIGDKVHFVATDGRRLCHAVCGHDTATDDFVREPKGMQKPAPILPVLPLAQLLNQCNANLTVSMKFGNGIFVANVGDVTVTATTIQGKFADWQDVFPDELPPGNAVSRALLDSAVKAAGVVTSEASRGVRFVFRNRGLTLKAKSSEGGESEVQCDVSEYHADAKMTLNPAYVTQFLRPFGNDHEPCVTMHVCPGDGRTVLTVGDEYRGVIMPLAEDA